MHPLTHVHLDIHKYIHTETCMTQVLKQPIPGTLTWSAETHHHFLTTCFLRLATHCWNS